MRSRLSVLVGVLASVVSRSLRSPRSRRGTKGVRRLSSCPTSGASTFSASMPGSTLLSGGIVVCILGLVFGLVIYRQLKNMAVHKSMLRDLGADLRDLQDLPRHAGEVHPAAGGLHRRHHGLLLRRAPALRAAEGRRHPAVLADRHRRQLRRGLVRHPHQHLRQLAHRLRQPQGEALPHLRHPAQGRHEHRHAAHQRRAGDDVVHPPLPPPRLRRRLLHRVRHRRVAGRLGAPHRGRHLHQDRRHRVGPDEDRLQHQGGRRAQPGRHRRLHR